MSDSLQPAIVLLSYIADAAVFAYAAYWAFSIRRAMVSRIYRNQALWLGVLCVIVLSGVVVPSPTTNDAVVIFLSNLPTIALALVLFAFVDSTVPLARRSDPRLRSILHWEKVRIIAWGLLILAVIVGEYGEFTSSNTSSTEVYPLLLLVVIGAPPMLVGARRSMDPNLRGCLKWFGLALVSLIGVLLVSFAELALNMLSAEPLNYSQIPYNAVVLLFGYFLYRSARSLAPINRITSLEPVAVPSADAGRSADVRC